MITMRLWGSELPSSSVVILEQFERLTLLKWQNANLDQNMQLQRIIKNISINNYSAEQFVKLTLQILLHIFNIFNELMWS